MKTWTDIHADTIDVARAFLQADNPRAAIREASRVLEIDADGTFAFAALDIIAHAEYDRRNFNRTREIGERLIALAPHRIQGYTHAAFAALETAKYPVVDTMVAEGLAINPRSVSLMVCVARKWRLIGDDTKAEAWARRALALQPDRSSALVELALAQASKGSHAAAGDTTERLRAIDPASFQPLMVGAFNAFNSFKFKEAERLSLAGLAIAPAHAGLQLTFRKSRFLNMPLFAHLWWFARATDGLTSWKVMAGLLVLIGVVCLLAEILPIYLGAYWSRAIAWAVLIWFMGSAIAALVGVNLIERSIEGRGKRVARKAF